MEMSVIDYLYYDDDMRKIIEVDAEFERIEMLSDRIAEKLKAKLTEEQLKEVEEAKKSPINFDEDCQELSPAMMKAFKSAVVQRNRKKKA